MNNRKLAAALVLATILIGIFAYFTSVYGQEQQLGCVYGTVYLFSSATNGYEFVDNALVIAEEKALHHQYDVRTVNGRYILCVPTGSYSLSVYLNGQRIPSNYNIYVSAGSVNTGYDFKLNELAIPEFSLVFLGLVSALAASVFVLRRRRQ